MDAILSIPAVTFLAIPFLSSYSTSLNLLFFYLTWSTLILSHNPLKVELIATLAVRLLFYLLPSLGFLLFDATLPSLAVNLKEHGEVALALCDEQGGKKGRWWKVMLVTIGNVLAGVALQTAIEYLFTEVFHIRSALRVTTRLPMPWSIAKNLLQGFLFREVLTYILHRYALHSRSSPLRKYHKKWYHSLPAPYSMTAHYDHPAAYLVNNFIPTYLPAAIFRFHLLTYCVYLALVSMEDLFAFSGYNVLPIGFILSGIARRQERHLMGGGAMGNYGRLGLVDLCMGTSLGADVIDNIRNEAETKEVGKRAKGKANATRRMTRRHMEE